MRRALLLVLLAGCASKRAPDPPVAITETPASTAAPLLSASTTAAAPTPAPTTAPTPMVDPADVARENALGWKMLAATGKPTENALVSAASLRQALAPLLLGARGATADEMASALGLEKDPTAAVTAENATWDAARGRSDAGKPRGVELAVANRLWIQNGFALLPDYGEKVTALGGAAPANVDFPAARESINGWVGEQTKGKIPELLPAGAVDARTKLVVTNAVWFKARWSQAFPPATTKDQPFRTAGATVNVPTMEATESFRSGAANGAKVLELRYADSELAMVIVLPDAKNGKLDPAAFDAPLTSGRVHVSLPKFTFKSGGAMKDVLAGLGMKTAFSDKADFSGIAGAKGSENLAVGQVFHQTWIAVDERGTEAAAATGGTMHMTAMPMGPITELKVDHPFWFAIRETKNGRILFAGRVTNPK